MDYVFGLIYVVLLLFLVSLLIRLVYDWVQTFARNWRPTGSALVLASGVYTVTDPPVKFLRRTIPPLRLGSFSLDVGFLLLFIGTYILMVITASMASNFA